MMIPDSVGLYVHIPFCLSKCRYCDFKSFACVDNSTRAQYIDQLCREIEEYRGKKVDSIFFGGGTPSLLTPSEFSQIASSIKKSFCISENTEFTVEANPKTLDPEKLRIMRECGVNRISIGLQSVNDNELKALGRIHTYDDFLSSFDMVRTSGIQSVNVDLMYGIPEQTKESFERTLDSVIALSPDHLSVYGLIIEEGTPFFENRTILPLPGEDAEVDMYFFACEKLRAAGYDHYEISNYAKKGMRCRHNLKYWQDAEYIGVGLAAHSYLDGKRYYNTDIMQEYLSDNPAKYRCEQQIEIEDAECEYAMMNLRLSDGISLKEYENRFDKSFLLGRESKVDEYISAGLLKKDKDRLFFTEKGFYLSNMVLSDILWIDNIKFIS